MRKTKFRDSIVSTVIATIGLFIVYGCDTNKDDWEISTDKCVFIEHDEITEGELIEGNYITGPMIDSPSYSYNSSAGILSGYISFDINKSLKLVYGRGRCLTGVAGGGVSTMLFGIYELPYQTQNLHITNVEANGTVHLLYNDSTIILKSNEEWIHITSGIDIQNNAGEIAKAKLTTTVRIVNNGIILKSNIVK